jgi:hypothetical protein
MFVTLIYIVLLKTVTEKTTQCRKQIEVLKRKKAFKWSKLMYLPHSFWLIAAMEFLLGGGWGCFLHINRYIDVRNNVACDPHDLISFFFFFVFLANTLNYDSLIMMPMLL